MRTFPLYYSLLANFNPLECGRAGTDSSATRDHSLERIRNVDLAQGMARRLTLRVIKYCHNRPANHIALVCASFKTLKRSRRILDQKNLLLGLLAPSGRASWRCSSCRLEFVYF